MNYNEKRLALIQHWLEQKGYKPIEQPGFLTNYGWFPFSDTNDIIVATRFDLGDWAGEQIGKFLKIENGKWVFAEINPFRETWEGILIGSTVHRGMHCPVIQVHPICPTCGR